MKRWQKLMIFCLALLVLIGVVTCVVGYIGTSDFRERRAVLRPLVATNAPLREVEAKAGVHFTVTRRGTPEWTQMLTRYTTGSKWDRHIAGMMEAASGVGHTSTMWMQTLIFLDDRDRLTGFELGAQ